MEGKVILSSSDGQVFAVDMKVAMISQTLSNMLKDTGIQAANFLHIQSLLDLSYQIVVEDIAACKDQQIIRQKYNIENDFSPEEEEEVLKLHNIFE
ncbi:hypothetical protein SUGI_0708480 [Cryptomeria japonica]|nr:hypothetical protein SUGI_0708480 [Cryptomeria japonica]